MHTTNLRKVGGSVMLAVHPFSSTSYSCRQVRWLAWRWTTAAWWSNPSRDCAIPSQSCWPLPIIHKPLAARNVNGSMGLLWAVN